MVEKQYDYIIAESYIPANPSGLHGLVHIRPIAGGKYSQEMHIECSKSLSNDYPVGTKFKLKVKLTSREGKGSYLYSNYNWRYEVL